MKIIDSEKLLDDLLTLAPDINKEYLMRALSRQPTMEAIPITFIRHLRDSDYGDDHKAFRIAMNHLLTEWRKQNDK